MVVQSGAGANSSYLDKEYQQAGVEVLPTAEAVFEESQLIVKVKEPQPSEVELLGPKHTLFAYLHLAADKALTESLTATGCTAIAYETLEVGGRLPLLEPMSELAGRMAATRVLPFRMSPPSADLAQDESPTSPGVNIRETNFPDFTLDVSS